MIVCADADSIVRRGPCGANSSTPARSASLWNASTEEPIYDEFVHKLAARTAQLRQGMDAEHDIRLMSEPWPPNNNWAIVSRHVDDAVSKGAKALIGGKPKKRRAVLRADGAGRRQPRHGLHA